MRTYTRFSYRDAAFRLAGERLDVVTAEIVRQREILQAYVARDPAFLHSLSPVHPADDAPEVARRMARAAWHVGVGPMAAVAGAMAQAAVEAAQAAGAGEVIVDNGGDVFLVLRTPAVIALYAGDTPIAQRLAFRVVPSETPLSICSSSSRMGHSLSLGDCDLATVVAKDGALADAAATQAGNLVRTTEDIEPALKRIMAIPGIRAVLIVKDDRVGLAGDLPQLQKAPGEFDPDVIPRAVP